MSSIVSLSPSRRNQSNDSRWISIRLGRSRTCLRRENDLRARGAVTVWAKKNSLPYWLRNEGPSREKGEQKRGGRKKKGWQEGGVSGRRPNPPGEQRWPGSRKQAARTRRADREKVADG